MATRTSAAPGGRADAPTEAGTVMAEEMLDRTDVQRTILEETAASAAEGRLTESGRTACNSGARIFAPAARRARSISLRNCPSGGTGIWHCHVSQDELLNANHSLPDMANVILDDVTASVVVGANSSEACLEPAAPRMAAEQFRDAVGVDATSSRDVVEALRRGHIPDPPAARQRVRAALPGLFRRRATPHPELVPRLTIATIPSHAPPPEEDDGAGHPDAGTPGGPAIGAAGGRDVGGTRQQAREVADAWRDLADISPSNIAASYIASTAIQALIDTVLFE